MQIFGYFFAKNTCLFERGRGPWCTGFVSSQSFYHNFHFISLSHKQAKLKCAVHLIFAFLASTGCAIKTARKIQIILSGANVVEMFRYFTSWFPYQIPEGKIFSRNLISRMRGSQLANFEEFNFPNCQISSLKLVKKERKKLKFRGILQIVNFDVFRGIKFREKCQNSPN